MADTAAKDKAAADKAVEAKPVTDAEVAEATLVERLEDVLDKLPDNEIRAKYHHRLESLVLEAEGEAAQLGV